MQKRTKNLNRKLKRSRKGGAALALKLASKNPNMAASLAKNKGFDPSNMMKQMQNNPEAVTPPAPKSPTATKKSNTSSNPPIREKKTPFYLYTAIICLTLSFLSTP